MTELKKDLLVYRIQEKERELGLFQRVAHADTGTINLHLALEERISDLQSDRDYTIDGKPRAIKEIVDGLFSILKSTSAPPSHHR